MTEVQVQVQVHFIQCSNECIANKVQELHVYQITSIRFLLKFVRILFLNLAFGLVRSTNGRFFPLLSLPHIRIVETGCLPAMLKSSSNIKNKLNRAKQNYSTYRDGHSKKYKTNTATHLNIAICFSRLVI